MTDVPQVPIATLQAWLAAAWVAYNNLMTGQGVVEIMADGYQAKYTRANAADLLAYIRKLERWVAGRSTVGAIGFTF
jgi:hypothetical protein